MWVFSNLFVTSSKLHRENVPFFRVHDPTDLNNWLMRKASLGFKLANLQPKESLPYHLGATKPAHVFRENISIKQYQSYHWDSNSCQLGACKFSISRRGFKYKRSIVLTLKNPDQFINRQDLPRGTTALPFPTACYELVRMWIEHADPSGNMPHEQNC